ncbi:ATP-binding cassette domain-containing protein [Streptomyces sp. AM 2-1-1]|uniref:ATP-binding cassette domain-containing protein n=1 Tax=Streptomyces sp. AM 2-1-1 TaxID=3028709 RepID=UPI0023B9AFA7|nr:ATP-binding cassette domain-containing protein [Streptomyces sp. AM 2-1-1]WEH42264.1 ATP-binding cassette domain-containing protein [Streptomyces sp. AM 2-1-1]
MTDEEPTAAPGPAPPGGAAVDVRGLGVRGPRGWAFRGVEFHAAAGTLVALQGPSGSGRTSLLLALTGRMRTTEGRAETGGFALPGRLAAVRRVTALGPVPGVSELDPALTVAEHLRERALLRSRYTGPVRALLRPGRERAAVAERIDEAVAAAGLDLAALPKAGRTQARDLERLESLRLSVALALLDRPRLLAVDDTDLGLDAAGRAAAWELLRSVAAGGTTVLAVCAEAPQDVFTVRTGPGAAPGAAATDTAGSPAPGAGRTTTAVTAGTPGTPGTTHTEKEADHAGDGTRRA